MGLAPDMIFPEGNGMINLLESTKIRTEVGVMGKVKPLVEDKALVFAMAEFVQKSCATS